MKKKLIILTDPGQDQAAAILMILGAPEAFEVLGLVATAGNIDLGHTTADCLKLLELAGRTDIPVFAGCPRPVLRGLVTAEHVHGPTGLDGPDLPEPTTTISPVHGVDFIVRTLREAELGAITICSLSPLTNLAMALVQAPDIAPRISEIVAMAGAYFEVGNITPTAEFNVYVDPEAARIVLEAGIPTTLLPLDVTHKMLSTPARLAAMRALANRCGIATAEMLEFSESFDLDKYGWDGAPLHGPCVPTFMLSPDIFSGRRINVSVETSGALTLGMTVADWWGITDRPKNAFYVRDGDPDRFYALLLECLGNLP
ncbi:nucleoside hydrolase [Allomesorhizobium camelthorni]|uniref:Nucleoside hydrolase n=1 Tax=Allomesorhizobium camelthorni TaxID=475069 RepID=A0A6G4WIW6_9HYPH|nr:nucleoside hydrolase [Mesorhizobium camelthorni]